MKNKYNGMKFARDWVGKKVRVTRELNNGVTNIPAGFKCVVKYLTSRGLTLQSEACKCCGVSVYITRVGYFDIELDQEAGSNAE